MQRKVLVVDSHTEGEPTRVVVEGGPRLVSKTLSECVRELRDRHDSFRTAVVCEPRGSDALVGALLMPPATEESEASVIFFNNVGYLGMCGHGTIGLVETLRHLGRVRAGQIRIDTPVGTVRATLHEDGKVSVYNVRSRRSQKDVRVDVPGYGTVTGDVAYGGNWFFLTSTRVPELTLANVSALTAYATAIRHALEREGIAGDDGGQIDHVELFGPPDRADADSKNFVLCPGLAYDRSPCGTGTSAKLACVAEDGKLAPGQTLRQESLIGTLFEGTYERDGESILPCITGRAHVIAEATLLFSDWDPLRDGIRL